MDKMQLTWRSFRDLGSGVLARWSDRGRTTYAVVRQAVSGGLPLGGSFPCFRGPCDVAGLTPHRLMTIVLACAGHWSVSPAAGIPTSRGRRGRKAPRVTPPWRCRG
jgi:hypothetical protein